MPSRGARRAEIHVEVTSSFLARSVRHVIRHGTFLQTAHKAPKKYLQRTRSFRTKNNRKGSGFRCSFLQLRSTQSRCPNHRKCSLSRSQSRGITAAITLEVISPNNKTQQATLTPRQSEQRLDKACWVYGS